MRWMNDMALAMTVTQIVNVSFCAYGEGMRTFRLEIETNGGRREEVARQRMIVKASCAARDPEMPLQ